MVLPIIIGIGATIAALTARSTFAAYRKYVHLTPEMIAALNNIRVINHSHPYNQESSHHQHIRKHYPNRAFGEPMTEREALLVMGIEGDDIVKFNKKMLRERYRKLMVMNHPDRNGSEYLTQKINQAKDILEKSYIFRNDKT